MSFSSEVSNLKPQVAVTCRRLPPELPLPCARADTDSLDNWLHRGGVHVVKSGSHRTVYRVDAAECGLYVKHYHARSTVGRGKQLFRRSAARREYRNSVELARRGLPTATPLAFGEIRRRGLTAESYFVSREIEGGRPLDALLFAEIADLPSRVQSRWRRVVTIRLAEFCAAMHAAGVWQNDLHLGNILVRTLTHECAENSGGQVDVELFLIDLPGVKFSPPLGWRRSRDSLAMLLAGLRERTSRSERRRFWRSYLAARPNLVLPPSTGHDLASAERDIDAAAWRHAHRVVSSRDKRALRSNRDFQRMTIAGRTVHAVADVSTELLAYLASDPEQPIREARHSPIKISHSSVVVKSELTLRSGNVAVAYKRSRVKTAGKRLLSPLRPSRALRGWMLGHALLQRGIATARPLCVIEPRRGRDAWLATEWVAGARNLHLYLWELAQRPLAERANRAAQCAAGLGRLIGRLHGWNIAHRDLKACNLVAVEEGSDVRVLLIDLDGIQRPRRLTLATRVRDLARLATSMSMHAWLGRAAHWRFLSAYLRALHFGSRPDKRELKSLWRDVKTASALKRSRMVEAGKTVA